ncbi:MAG: hypothetical protein V1881_04195 [Candidatus Micrarchaeota archaeon]
MRVLAILVLCGVAYLAYLNVNEAMSRAKLDMDPVILKAEVDALSWVRENTPERTVFATDLVAGEMLMGHALREGIIGGDWAVVPSAVRRMRDVQPRIYGADNANSVCAMMTEYGARYLWVPKRKISSGYDEWIWPSDVFDDAQRFRRVFGNDGVAIYEVIC